MNEYAIYHRPESEYAYALDNRTLRIVLRVAENERLQAVELLYNNKYDFTERRNTVEMKLCASDGVFAYYGVNVTLADVRFAYIFKIKEKGKTYYYSENGLTESYDFALAYYDFFQFPFINPSDTVKRIPWTASAVFYQIFVDRFCRGNFTKDGGYITQKWEEIPTAKSYCGGDLKGITQKLDYLADTGINALYLTPVFTANSNHKYNISSYEIVDFAFGSLGDLCDLLDEAHTRGMRVILDAVFNHCDCTHKYFADVMQKGRESEYYDWFMIDGDSPDLEKGNYAHFADCKYMPKWNTNNSAVRQYLIGIAVSYLNTGFDGLRLDVADEVSHTMWRELREAVKAIKPDALILGEVWHENTHYLRGDEFDGVMNYRVQKAFIDYFACGKITAKEVANKLNRVLMQNFEQVNAMMLNFLDNHDTPRFLRFCGGDKDRLLAALCALVLFPGMPCIFYGTELPLDGGGDPDCRRTFDWTFASQDEEYFSRYKQILALKKEACAQNGNTEIGAKNGLLIIVRESACERLTAVFNTETARSFACAGELLYGQNYDGKTLGSNGVFVFKEKKVMTEKLLQELKEYDAAGKDIKTLYTEISELCMKYIAPEKREGRRAYYLSIEYLMGRMFHNNLLELGVLEEAEKILSEKGVNISDFEEIEDAALGNGGLGRLAACFLDSAAGCGYPLDGYGIRYKYGLFKQKFENGEQAESADDWLSWGDPWSVRRENEKRVVHFADMDVTAVPYDMPIVGKSVNTLRLFAAEGSEQAQKICEYLYPADDTEEGKLLRIRQEYFLSAAAIGELAERYVEKHGRNFNEFAKYHSLQLNDTHAVMSVAEFIRLLTKNYGVSFARALDIAKHTFNYTNHTILPEALECWNYALMEKILPEIAEVFKTIQIYAEREWKRKKCSKEEIAAMSVLHGESLSMANAAVYVGEKVNGVAAIHSELVKRNLFPVAYKYYPDKFQNVTNGITQRRWLMLCNRELSALLDSKLTSAWREDMTRLETLDTTDTAEFIAVKAEKKKQLAEYILRHDGIQLLDGAIVYAQVKRLHEYKRQLMTAFAILRIYYDLKEGKLKDFHPSVFLFGAKAASGYFRAKGIIKYLNEIARLVNNDEQTNKLLQVVFVQNYNVSYAEKIVAGADVSLQVSTAGFEASGTGNMKFMLNGAVTCGTMDGANIEIVEHAGKDNNYIFGASVEEIERLKDTYEPNEILSQNPDLKRVAETLTDGTFSDGGKGYFKELYDSLTIGAHWHKPDHYFIFRDLPEYVDALIKVNRDYGDKAAFAKKQMENTAHAAFFSSDRSIAEYAEKIWKIVKR